METNIFITEAPAFLRTNLLTVDLGMSLGNSPSIAVLNAWTRKAPTFDPSNLEIRCKNSFFDIMYDPKETSTNFNLDQGRINFSSVYRHGNWSNDFIGNMQTTVLSVFEDLRSELELKHETTEFEKIFTIFNFDTSRPQFSNQSIDNYWFHVYGNAAYSGKLLEKFHKYINNCTVGKLNIIFVTFSPFLFGGKIKMLHNDERNDYELSDYLVDKKVIDDFNLDNVFGNVHYILLSSRNIGQIRPNNTTYDTMRSDHQMEIIKKGGIRESDLIANERATRAIMLCARDGFRRAQEVFSPYTFQKG